MKRKYYIDNIRWLFILLLIPFHAAMAYNTWESNYIWIEENKLLSSFVIFISPYYMPTLFVLAGMSMKYSLKKRSGKQFLKERVRKLFIPLVVGIITVVPVMTFFADRFHNGYGGSFIEHYGIFFTNLSDFTGYDGYFTPGHLWFILFLFIVSIIAYGIIVLQKKFCPNLSFKNCKVCQVIFLIILPVLMKGIFDFGGKSIGESLAFVLLGYYIFSEDEVVEKLSEYSGYFLTITIVSVIIYNYIFVFLGIRDSVTNDICPYVALWFGVLGIIGFASNHMNWNNRITKYLSANSFKIYIIHFMWIVIIQFYLSRISNSIAVCYIVSVAFAFACTFLTVEILNVCEKKVNS